MKDTANLMPHQGLGREGRGGGKEDLAAAHKVVFILCKLGRTLACGETRACGNLTSNFEMSSLINLAYCSIMITRFGDALLRFRDRRLTSRR